MNLDEGSVAALLTAAILAVAMALGSLWVIDVYWITDSVPYDHIYLAGLAVGSFITICGTQMSMYVGERVEEWIETDIPEVEA